MSLDIQSRTIDPEEDSAKVKAETGTLEAPRKWKVARNRMSPITFGGHMALPSLDFRRCSVEVGEKAFRSL